MKTAEEILRKVCKYSDKDISYTDDDITFGEALEAMEEYSQQVKEAQSKELTDILECIAKFDQNESLAHKGMCFNTIQKDVINYLKSKV